MRVLIACETSGEVRGRLRNAGVDAWSVDVLPADDDSPFHIQGDMFDLVDRPAWKVGVFHPTCTFLTCSAEWAYKDADFDRYPGVGYHQRVKPETLTGSARREAREKALSDIRRIMALPYPCIIENPKGVIGSRVRKADQIVQPYDFGDDASKATCFWLTNGAAPLAVDPSQRRGGRMVEWPRGSGKLVERWSNQTDSGQNNAPPSGDRWKDRSKTFAGIADAITLSVIETLKGLGA